jgi:hypothetical protein
MIFLNGEVKLHVRQNMSTLKKILNFAIPFFCGGILSWYVFGLLLSPKGELIHYQDNGTIQSLYYRYKDKNNSGGIIKDNDYNAVGFPIADKKIGYVWFLTLPLSDSHINYLPTDERFRITLKDIDEITASMRVNGDVLIYLKAMAESK